MYSDIELTAARALTLRLMARQGHARGVLPFAPSVPATGEARKPRGK
jgi:hypothetical protein